MNEMKLGDLFEFDTIARKRRFTFSPDEEVPEKPPADLFSSVFRGRSVTWSLWTKRKLYKPRVGMYIGWRTVKDGEVRYIDEEIGNAFFPKRNHKVWLFVVNERTNPIHVFPEDVREIA